MKKYAHSILLPLFVLIGINANAQNPSTDDNASLIYTADSLATGNYKDILSSFFQLAANNLTGKNKEFHFTSNPYAILSRHNKEITQSKYYKKAGYQFLRRLNADINVQLDSNFNFNGFSTGLRYALWDQRDVSISKYFMQQLNNASGKNDNFYHALNDFLGNEAAKIKNDNALQILVVTQIQKLFNTPGFTFDKLDANVSAWILGLNDPLIARLKVNLATDPKLNIYTQQRADYDALVAEFQTKPLLTIGASDTSYRDGRLFKNAQIGTAFLKGFGKKQRVANIEMDIKMNCNFSKDTTQPGNNLKRMIFVFEPGLNFILKGKQNHQSYFEFKLSGSYNNTFKGLYAGESQVSNTINGTFKIRVLNEIWLPFQVKYDPQNGNVFGFLNITANFKSIGDLFKSQSIAAN